MDDVYEWLEDLKRQLESENSKKVYNKQNMLFIAMDIRDRIQNANDDRYVGLVNDLEQMANTFIVCPNTMIWTRDDILEFVYNIMETIRLGLDV